jgi:jumonji domain-containing protein 7
MNQQDNNINDASYIRSCFDLLAKQQRDFYGQECTSIEALEIDTEYFLFHHVKQNRPVIIKNAVNHWPALHKWKSNNYLIEQLQESLVSVAMSPNGRVDAVHGEYFVEPEVKQMTLEQFFNRIDQKDRSDILYVQQQNGNLKSEFECLMNDIDLSCLEYVSRAFNTDMDAVNIWIGTEESVSSAHKDHYENLYVQICGKKIFYILPPSAVTHLDVQMYKAARYQKQGEQWNIIPNDDNYSTTVPWIKLDFRHAYESHLNNIYPMKVELSPGDVLYLPSLWYHQVEQQNDEHAE